MSDLAAEAKRVRADAAGHFNILDSILDQISTEFEDLDKSIINEVADVSKKIATIEKRSISMIRKKAQELTKNHSVFEMAVNPVKQFFKLTSRPPKKTEFKTNQTRMRLIENLIQYDIPVVISIPSLSPRDVKSIQINLHDNLQTRWFHQAPWPIRREPSTYFDKKQEVIGYGTSLMTFNQPSGVAYNPVINKICVAEYGNHRIQIFDLDLKQSSTFGRKGFEVGRFTNPHSICISPSGLIAICDSSYYIQLFTDNFGHGRLFGEEGSGPGRFSMGSLKYVAFDAEENIYVTDSKNHNVQKFNMDGTFQRFLFKRRANEIAGLTPAGIAVNDYNEILVLLQPISQVRVYSTAGIHLRTHELRDVSSPSGISRGPCGGFIVSDEEGRMVRMYNRDGFLQHYISSHSPRGVCFSPDDDLYIVDYYGARISRY